MRRRRSGAFNQPRVLQFGSIDSTSSEAFRRAEAGEAGHLWIVAERQLKGRGRRNRAWTSERGNLYASVLLRPPVPATRAGELSFVAAVALYDAIAVAAPAVAGKLALKWPNDLLISGRKVSGILLESRAAAGASLDALVIGFGVNCASHPGGVDYPVTDLASEGAPVLPAGLFGVLAAEFSAAYETWTLGEGFAAIRSAWLARAAGLGAAITVRLPNREIRGIFEALGPDGALAVRGADGALRHIAAGEVFFAPAGSASDPSPQGLR
ncbi:MAG: biotin--[acetyl-CoA-carboxylase] ligase [Hyphomicrobiales bacterium]|nr:biotin--[acetyl-CoA-carboxylase] ligase [Hyphomicrobiales bacterium]